MKKWLAFCIYLDVCVRVRLCVYVCACVRACCHFQFLLIIFRRDEHTKTHTQTHRRTHTHTHQHTNAVTHKNAYITHERSWIDDTDTYTPWNIQEIVEQYVELGAVTVAGACNLWTAGLSEVGTRAKRLRITRSATTAPNGAALISAQFRVPRRIRGAWRRTLFSKTSHCQMCFRMKF